MIRKLVAAGSALIFLVGAVGIVLGAVLAWLWIVAAAASQTHWTVGAAVFALSLWAGQRYEAWLQTPWRLWYALWSHLDAEMERRIR